MRSALTSFKLFLNAKRSSANRKMLSLLGNQIEGVIARTDQGLFAVDVEDMVVGKSLLKQGRYGDDEIERASKFLTTGSNVLIVGAHIGALAIPLAKRCAHVTAIEANPKTFRLLESNIGLNKAANVTALNVAASDKTETLQFVVSRANSGGSKRMPKTRDNIYFYDSPEVVEVPACSLDELLGARRFDLVIMDIEGSEYFALKGMQKILQDVGALFIEFVPHHLRNVAGVTVDDMLGYISPHFEYLYLPSLSQSKSRPEFLPALQQMYDVDQVDDGLIFSKRKMF